MQPWSFNQPVLLNKSHHNRSVLVWTIVGATAFAGAWAFLAPLPETVALQGKLQPARPVQDIESAVDGQVAAVPVKEGDSVAVGDLLVRFDPRDAETRLQAARRKRSQLQSQVHGAGARRARAAGKRCGPPKIEEAERIPTRSFHRHMRFIEIHRP